MGVFTKVWGDDVEIQKNKFSMFGLDINCLRNITSRGSNHDGVNIVKGN